MAAAGAGASVTGAAGASCTGGAERDDFGAACFLAGAAAAAVAGRGDGNGVFAAGAECGEAAARGAAVAVALGSGVMMLIGGVEAAEGNSAFVGLPVGIDGGSAATIPGDAGGAFQVGA